MTASKSVEALLTYNGHKIPEVHVGDPKTLISSVVVTSSADNIDVLVPTNSMII